MPIGPAVRRLFGPYERRISEAYRRIYLDVDALVANLRGWVPHAANILEVGCGEGAVTERLVSAYPKATITGIDVTPRVGRLYGGPADRVRFIQCTAQELAATEAGRYDFVILADVLHHVPDPIRQESLESIRALMAPGASFVFKEWARNQTPIYWIGYLSGRWITGDRVRYMTRGEARERLARIFGDAALVAEAYIAPWRNNLATLVRP